MKLSELLSFREITLQCHDNPDADAIGASYALLRYFQAKGKPVRIVYSGRTQITKPNLQLLIKELQIPIGYVEDLDVPGVLVTVDCQYGAGNVTRLKAEHVAIIDHHQQEAFDIPLCEIRSFLGSCSTLVWQLLEAEGFRVREHLDISTALYYGLFSDTNSFTEINHPADRDMQDFLEYDFNLLRRLKNSNLTIKELEIAGVALLRSTYNAVNRFAVIKTHPCDPNILGFISDLAIQVDSIDVCIVYNEMANGIKYSVRSCVKEVMASELAAYLAEGIGSGGGHLDKAGGFISQSEFNRQFASINTEEYLLTRLSKYYGSFEVIDCATDKVDTK
ncbi:MAG: DHH family phosphoesterase, partial [Clostridia bacterium]|nr:DHH family phosphoesterase [Clostridia bacterium]